jgi:hypothetical protein
LRLLACVALVSAGLPVLANQEVARIPIVDAPPGTPGLGGGVRLGSNPYNGESDTLEIRPTTAAWRSSP